NLVLVACSALATDSVEGQRGRPSGVTRLDLLNVVGSRPAFLAKPEGVNLARAANRSMAVHIWLGVGMAMDAGTMCDCEFEDRNYSLESPPCRNSFLQRLP